MKVRVKKAMLRRGDGEVGEQSMERARCGLCGQGKKTLTRTACCGRIICDDEGTYVLFSYARNSCSRNHSRFTLCGLHHNEGHAGDWKTCDACREHFAELEMYVHCGTNAYNFEKLENPPTYEPTRCAGCRRVIVLGEEGFVIEPNGAYRCEDCFKG